MDIITAVFIVVGIVHEGLVFMAIRYLMEKASEWKLQSEDNYTNYQQVLVDVDKVSNIASNTKAKYLEELKSQTTWNDERIQALEKNYEYRLNVMEGQLKEAKIRGSKYDFLTKQHEWHIGGKVAIHGNEPMIQFECNNCPAVVIAPKEFFND